MADVSQTTLTKQQRRALMKGGGRYMTQTQAFKELRAMGLADAVPAKGRVTADGQHVGAWKWVLTEAGKQLQREVAGHG